MDYTRHRHSPGPRVASAGATTTTFSQSPSFGQALSQQPYGTHSLNEDGVEAMTPRPNNEVDEDEGQEVSWWSSYNQGGSNQTPRAATFVQVADADVPASTDGFISLMDTPFSTAPASPSKQTPPPKHNKIDDDEEEDLGFGNFKPKKSPSGEDQPQAAAPVRAATAARPGKGDFHTKDVVINKMDRHTANSEWGVWFVDIQMVEGR
jgi:hypothetical protein